MLKPAGLGEWRHEAAQQQDSSSAHSGSARRRHRRSRQGTQLGCVHFRDLTLYRRDYIHKKLSDLKHVWLPGSGVWAAVPTGQPAAAPRSPAESRARDSSHKRREVQQGEERQRGRQKREREPAAQHPSRRERSRDALKGGANPAGAGGAAAAGSPPAAAVAAAHPASVTGYALQQDKEDSDIEEVEAPPTCPIVSARRDGRGLQPAGCFSGAGGAPDCGSTLAASGENGTPALPFPRLLQCLVDIVELSDKAVVTPCMVGAAGLQARCLPWGAGAALNRGARSRGIHMCILHALLLRLNCSTTSATTASGAGCPTTSASARSARRA